jgi:hypothetical protein
MKTTPKTKDRTKRTPQNTRGSEGVINSGQSRETGNVCTYDEEIQSKSTIQHALATTVRKQT